MVGIIIQARMGSSRLPGKILKDFEGRSLLGHIVKRLKGMKSEAVIVIATSNSGKDDAVERFCKESHVRCFRGDELNVLKRYYDCATAYRFSDIVRMTGDNPFPDMEELDRLIAFHLENRMDFSENFSELPVGVGMEVISYKALGESLRHATLPKHFEHADEYVLDNWGNYRCGTQKAPEGKRHPEVRLTVDTPDDYEKACFILREAGHDPLTTERAIMLGMEYERRNGGT